MQNELLTNDDEINSFPVTVAYFNGRVVAAGANGKLTILNEDLEVVAVRTGTEVTPRSISANSNYLAMSDDDGVIRYYKIHTGENPKVSF